MMITAGIHGNERASIYAARKLVRLLYSGTVQLDAGRLIIVPLVNRKAYRRRHRGVPDLNRTFPRSVSHEAVHPLSEALCKLMKRHRPSWYIDLHEANGLSKLNRSVLGQTLVTQPRSIEAGIAKRIIKRVNLSIPNTSRHFTVRQHHLPGSGRTAAFRLLGCKAITVETCWSLAFPDRVSYQMHILRQLLKESGLIQQPAEGAS